ncbi:MAG: phospho-N-acetylmuramoyl-pentapeptide-transferase [Ruminococcus sp.]|nr:phospho-N-acetylmuramoyl-pentapeptide-transferase [Ruminococcus sp.]
MIPIWLKLLIPIVSFIIAGVIGKFLIPFMHKISFGQTIEKFVGSKLESHQKKQGTPIMGGFMFIISSVVMTIVGYVLYRVSTLDITATETSKNLLRMFACLIYALCFCGIGFADDYTKAVKKQNLGLTPKQKMLFQFIFSGLFLAVLYFLGDTSTEIDFIFASVDFGVLYYPIMILFMIFLSNAVNLTDGIDGLCGSVTVITMLALSTICGLMSLNEISIFAIAIAGGCLGFLIWNLHPAKIFMGDTGSMFLGGSFVAIGMCTHKHLLVVLIGLIYVCEALSVVIQVTYFKITKKFYGEGRRIFKMTPIHHHFELCGFSEYKIVITFSIVSLIAGVIAVML